MGLHAMAALAAFVSRGLPAWGSACGARAGHATPELGDFLLQPEVLAAQAACAAAALVAYWLLAAQRKATGLAIGAHALTLVLALLAVDSALVTVAVVATQALAAHAALWTPTTSMESSLGLRLLSFAQTAHLLILPRMAVSAAAASACSEDAQPLAASWVAVYALLLGLWTLAAHSVVTGNHVPAAVIAAFLAWTGGTQVLPVVCCAALAGLAVVLLAADAIQRHLHAAVVAVLPEGVCCDDDDDEEEDVEASNAAAAAPAAPSAAAVVQTVTVCVA